MQLGAPGACSLQHALIIPLTKSQHPKSDPAYQAGASGDLALLYQHTLYLAHVISCVMILEPALLTHRGARCNLIRTHLRHMPYHF